MRDTIDMAREAGAIHVHGKPKEFAIVGNYALKAFEALVRADERKQMQEPVAQAWSEGYRAGIDDERMSEANIGIAGFDAKIEPARNNRTISPAAQRQWVGLTDEAIWLEYQTLWPFHPAEEPRLAKDIAKFVRAIEAKLKEKNT